MESPDMRFIPNLVALAAAVVMLAPATAHEKTWAAPLLGTSETPSVNTPGTGQGSVTIDFDLFTMRVQASFQDLTGNVTAAHIHCCTSLAGTGNAGVASQTPSFTGFPTGVKAGTYDKTFDMSLASSYNAAFITARDTTPGDPSDNVVLAFNALVAGLDAGKAYLNLHTSTYSGGEIRGLLVPVPEPETYALMLAGLGVLGWAARRKQQA
jgi:hypothetical protein